MLLQKKVIKTKTSLLYTCAEDLHTCSVMQGTCVQCYVGHLDHVTTKGDKDKDQSFVHVRRRPAHVIANVVCGEIGA